MDAPLPGEGFSALFIVLGSNHFLQKSIGKEKGRAWIPLALRRHGATAASRHGRKLDHLTPGFSRPAAGAPSSRCRAKNIRSSRCRKSTSEGSENGLDTRLYLYLPLIPNISAIYRDICQAFSNKCDMSLDNTHSHRSIYTQSLG